MVAWLLTLPASACIGAAAYGLSSLFGAIAGPVIISVAGALATIAIFVRRVRHPEVAPA